MTAAQQESTTNYWHLGNVKREVKQKKMLWTSPQQHFTIFKYDLQINPGWKLLAEVLKLSHNAICITLQPFFPSPPSKASRFHDLVVVLVSGSRGPLVKHWYSLCTGKTTQKAGLRCSFQAAAVSLGAITRTLKMKLVNIYRLLKISYSFKQTRWKNCLSVMDV